MIFNKNCKFIQVTSYLKRQWIEEVETTHKCWAKKKKIWGKITLDREKFKQAYNAFYRIVCKVKRECQQNFLERKKRDSDLLKIWSEDKNRC